MHGVNTHWGRRIWRPDTNRFGVACGRHRAHRPCWSLFGQFSYVDLYRSMTHTWKCAWEGSSTPRPTVPELSCHRGAPAKFFCKLLATYFQLWQGMPAVNRYTADVQLLFLFAARRHVLSFLSCKWICLYHMCHGQVCLRDCWIRCAGTKIRVINFQWIVILAHSTSATNRTTVTRPALLIHQSALVNILTFITFLIYIYTSKSNFDLFIEILVRQKNQ